MWEHRSLDWLKAFKATGLDIRAVSTTFGSDLGDGDSPWSELAPLFMTPLADKYDINVVIGFGTVFTDKVTALCAHNVAITANFPRNYRPGEGPLFKGYDYIWVPDSESKANFFKLDRVASIVQPNPEEIVWAMGEIL